MTSSSTDSPLVVAGTNAWREWLEVNDDHSDGVWLMLAKKGTTSPTSLTYQEALEEALCSGWIDGQRKAFDEYVFLQRFTPRRTGSVWSQRNVAVVARLVSEGRLRPRGIDEIERAKADGRWERAYPGSAAVEVPAELTEALAAEPAAQIAFAALSRSERYSALHPILTAPNEALRAKRVNRLLMRLKTGRADD